MLKILIVDDELPARSRMRRLLGEQAGSEVCGEAGSGNEALVLVERLQPDVLLLDISMPGLDGLGLARKLKNRDDAPLVIFCTAFEDHALTAFEFDAIDYLVKPVSAERLGGALERARRFLGMDRPEAFLASTLGGSTELIDIGDITCLLAEDKYTTVYLCGRTLMINHSLTEIEQAHPDWFIRVHRSALVARNRVRGLERGDGGMHVLVEDCSLRPVVSRRQLPAVRRLIKELQ